MSYETDVNEQTVRLVFQGVEAYKVTYYNAVPTAVLEAYNRLIDLGRTAWLDEISGNLKRRGENPVGLVHLMITFDDGPCYEVICRSHRIQEGA
jgi:hypothetical protein